MRNNRRFTGDSRSPGTQPVRSMRAGIAIMMTGGVICGLGAFSIVISLLYIRDVLGGAGPTWRIYIHLGTLLIGVGEIAAGNFILRISLRHFAKTIYSPQDLDSGPFVLYLRSFGDDPRLAKIQPIPLISALVRGWFVPGSTEEEQLAAALMPVGPMVAVGAPGEKLPQVGAKRMYLPYENWQEPVRDLMLRARLVVLVLGPGAGTMWELTEAMCILPPERLLLVVPMEYEEYEKFQRAAAAELRIRAKHVLRDTGKHWSPPRLPDYTGHREISSRIQGLIYYSSDWEPTFTRLQSFSLLRNFLRDCLDRAIRPVVVQLSEYERNATGVQTASFGQLIPPTGHPSAASSPMHSHLHDRSMGTVSRLWSTGALHTTLGVAIMLGLLVWIMLGLSVPWTWFILTGLVGALSFSHGQTRRRRPR